LNFGHIFDLKNYLFQHVGRKKGVLLEKKKKKASIR
jgi:hypothetical protein